MVDYAAEAASFGAVYLEGIFSPGERMERGVWPRTIFQGYPDGAVEAQERYGVTVRFTPDLTAASTPTWPSEVARQCLRYADRGRRAGSGRTGDAPADALRAGVRDRPVRRAGASSRTPARRPGRTRSARCSRMDPDRIRHGIRAVEDPDVLAEIVDRGWCSTCVRPRTCVPAWSPSIAEHPLPRLRAAGVLCTINTDDPAMFGTDLGQEYELAAVLGVTAADAYARRCRRGGLRRRRPGPRLTEIGRAAFGS